MFLYSTFKINIQDVLSITRPDVAEQSGEMTRSLAGPLLRYENMSICFLRNDICTTKKLTTLDNSLSHTLITFSLSLSSSHFIIFVAKEHESCPKKDNFLGVQITPLLFFSFAPK
jgi:hypothetical protein